MSWINKLQGKEKIHIKVKIKDFEEFQFFLISKDIIWISGDNFKKFEELKNSSNYYNIYLNCGYVHLIISKGRIFTSIFNNNLISDIIIYEFTTRKDKMKKILG